METLDAVLAAMADRRVTPDAEAILATAIAGPRVADALAAFERLTLPHLEPILEYLTTHPPLGPFVLRQVLAVGHEQLPPIVVAHLSRVVAAEARQDATRLTEQAARLAREFRHGAEALAALEEQRASLADQLARHSDEREGAAALTAACDDMEKQLAIKKTSSLPDLNARCDHLLKLSLQRLASTRTDLATALERQIADRARLDQENEVLRERLTQQEEDRTRAAKTRKELHTLVDELTAFAAQLDNPPASVMAEPQGELASEIAAIRALLQPESGLRARINAAYQRFDAYYSRGGP